MTTKKQWNPYHSLIHTVLKYVVVILVAVVGIAKSIPVHADVTGDVFKDCLDCPEMVTIPAGSFEMGSGALYQPIHRVNINAFALGKTEVTQGQWLAVMGNNPSHFSSCGDNCPVENVSWDDVKAFIQKLNAKSGKQYRLPSEAEWEYACRAGGQNVYCGSDNVDSVAWHTDNSSKTTHPISRKQPNAFGLYDMSGSVWEWVEDIYHSYVNATINGNARPGDGTKHVIRGGSWVTPPTYARAGSRFWFVPVTRDNALGFRVARMLPAASSINQRQGAIDSTTQGQSAIANDILTAYSNDLATVNMVADNADYALLAWAAYGDQIALDAAKERGWSLKEYVNKNLFVGDTVTKLFVSKNGGAVLAYRGSDTKGDWITNIVGTLSINSLFTAQINGARGIAVDIVKNHPDVVFVGHSLGGRMAQVARLATGNAAVIFNSAPLGLDDQLRTLFVSPKTLAKLLTFRSPDDPLTELLSHTETVVKNIEITKLSTWGNVITAADYTHNMGVLAAAMQDVRTARDEGWIANYLASNDKTRGSVAGNVFKDCPDCPDMINIPTGSFEMGSNEGEPNEKPAHKVTVNAFALGKTEVTQGQWLAVMGNNPSHFSSCGNNCPVGNVSWDAAMEFTWRLNAKTGKQYRLPSEAEWEYACRAGGQNVYCGSDNVDSVAWHKDNSGAIAHPVGLKTPNAFGLYDMSGNMEEWAEDVWHDNYNGAPINGSAWQGDSDYHVARGGTLMSVPGYVRAASRMLNSEAGFSTLPIRHRFTIGFRVARVSAGADSAVQDRVDNSKNIAVPPLLSQGRFPVTTMPHANSDLSAEESQLDNCQRLVKQNITEQAIAACLPLVWSKNSKIRKLSSGSFADAVTEKNRSLSSNQPKSLPILPDPYIVHGGCPGEGCMFGMWSAQVTIQIFEQPESKKVIGQLVRGERVAALLGELRVHPLKGVVVGKIDQLRLGESVYLLDYVGEGQSKMWIRGQVVGDPRWDFSCKPTPACETAIRFSGEKNGLKKGEVVHADSVWWVKIQRRNGQTGWVRTGAGFSGTDRFGGGEEADSIPDPFDEMPMATASKDALPI